MRIMTKSGMVATLATSLFLVTGASAATAAAPEDGCARGFELWDVDDPANDYSDEMPYMADNRVDENGNGDGSVCARALGGGVSISVGMPSDFVVYEFSDNDLAASSID